MKLLNFEFIDTLSKKSGHKLYKNLADKPNGIKNLKEFIENWKHVKYADNDFSEIPCTNMLSYDFKIIYGAIVKGGLLLSLAWLLDILVPTLVVTACFGIIRFFAGGLHFKSYTLCTYVSLISLLSLGYIGSHLPYNWFASTIMFGIVIINIIKFAPVENDNLPIKDGKKPLFKKIALINTVVLFVLNVFICQLPITLGVFMAGIITLPLFNRLKQ